MSGGGGGEGEGNLIMATLLTLHSVLGLAERNCKCWPDRPLGSNPGAQMKSFINPLCSNKSGADPGFFLGGVHHYYNAIFFFCGTPVVLESHRSSQGGVCTPCTLPLDLPL